MELNEPFFQTERKQEAHFDYYQRPLQADSTATAKLLRSGIRICIRLTCLKRAILWLNEYRILQIHNCRSL